MKTNIFLKSVLRQPIRTLILALLVGIAAFAFVARAAEFIVVRSEIRRVEGFFPSIGVLSPTNPQNFTEYHDVSHAAQIISQSRYLAFEDRRVFTQGVLQDRRNTASHVVPFNHMVPALEGLDIKVFDQYFYAIVVNEPRLVTLGDMNFFMIFMEVDGHIVGDPMALRPYPLTFTNDRGQTATVLSRQNFFLPITEREAELYRQGRFNPVASLTSGRRYIFRAIEQDISPGGIDGTGTRWYLRPLGGEDGFKLEERPVPGRPDINFFELNIFEELRDENLVFYVDVRDQAAVNAKLASIRDDIDLADMNLSSVTVVGTQDMTAIPRFTDQNHARLLDRDGGRWLNHDDHINANPVALIPGRLAIRSDLRLGETFTITLRNNPRPAWIDQETNSLWSLRTEGWWEHTYRGWWGMASGDNWREVETYELTLEVVGVYWFFPPVGEVDNFSANEIFIPASLIPDGFGWDGAPLLSGMYSFTLNSARHEDAFIREYSDTMEDLGFTIGFLPSGFDVFDAAMAPIRTSITINLAAFTAVSILILALVVFLYLRQWSKALAIVRALGLPTGTAMRRFFTPVFCIWMPAIAIGAVAGWLFSLGQAESTLAAVEGLGQAVYVNANISLFFALFACIVLLTVAGVISSGFVVAGRPVLEQIQGTGVKRVKVLPVADAGAIDFKLPAAGFNVGEPLRTTAKAAFVAGFRHITRRIVRTPVKSLLALVLALFFVVSLGWMSHTIQFTEAEIERFMYTTVITADITRLAAEDRGTIEFGFENAYIGQVAIDTVLNSGFVQDAYLEASWLWGAFGGFNDSGDYFAHTSFLGITCLGGFVAGNTRTPLDDQLGIVGDSLEIEFAPNFNVDDFVFTHGNLVPIVVRKSAMESMNLTIGDTIGMYDTATVWVQREDGEWVQPPPVHLASGEIVGYFTGGLNRAINRDENISIVVPEAFLRYSFQEHPFMGGDGGEWLRTLTYATARFYLDPARNRELYRIHDAVFVQLVDNHLGFWVGSVPLELLVHDDILSAVIEPMERNLALLNTLYPISIVVAVVLGFGLSLLLMLMNIKNAAIMRVLGMPKTKTQFSLWLEQVIVCADGAIIGLIVLFVIGVGLSATPFALAGIYFAGATLGSAVGAVIITIKTPLDLLQVRE